MNSGNGDIGHWCHSSCRRIDRGRTEFLMEIEMSVQSIMSVAALAAVTGLSASVASAQVAIEFSTVGNAGNAGDPGNFGAGAVAYEYRISAFEVTNAQYAEFLNVVAASDPNGLYNTNMGSDPRGGITRSGTPGSFTYAVRPNMGNKPVNFVSSLDAIRMANWLTNGQGSGSTESGVYTLSGNKVTAITRDLTNPKQVFLPTENEWKKAALHQPASQGGDADNFWKYPTQSNDDPLVATATELGDIANPTATTVNWQSGADWNGQNGNVTTVGSCQNTSFYGAFDMAGNIEEWLEDTSTLGGIFTRAITGGTFLAVPTFGILPEDTYLAPPMIEDDTLGFRFASPVPGSECFADCDSNGSLGIDDFICFQTLFALGENKADCDESGSLSIDDFICFQSFFALGC
jgi:formylglycine-generating enzyme required for sulfatase activity